MYQEYEKLLLFLLVTVTLLSVVEFDEKSESVESYEQFLDNELISFYETLFQLKISISFYSCCFIPILIVNLDFGFFLMGKVRKCFDIVSSDFYFKT